MSRRLLVVHHSRTGSTAALRDAALDGAADAAHDAGGGNEIEIISSAAFDTMAEDVLATDALLLCTPANFGYMSGALKDFFERIYHPCLDRTVGLPYALVVKGDTDVDGAVQSVERIVAGLRWRPIRPPLTVVGPALETDLADARELGGTIAASLAFGLL